MNEEITALELSTLAECERDMERGFQAVVGGAETIGRALLKIRDGRLWRKTHATFEEYCRQRWNSSRQWVEERIRAVAVLENLAGIPFGLPDNPHQIRPLASLQPERQREAWTVAVERSESGHPTGREVAAVVREMKSPPPTPAALEAELRAREAERRLEEVMAQRHDEEIGRYVVIRRLIEATKFIAEFYTDSVADTWARIWDAGGKDFEDHLKRAVVCLTRLEKEHPNKQKRPGIVIARPREDSA